MHDIGMLLQSQESFTEAEMYFKDGVSIAEAECGPQDERLMLSLGTLSILYQEIGRSREAQRLLRRVSPVLDQWDAWTPYEARPDSVDVLSGTTVGIGSSSTHPSHLTTDTPAKSNEALAHLKSLITCGRRDDAECYSTETLNKRREELGAQHADILGLMSDMGDVFARAGNIVKAITLEENALTAWNSKRDSVQSPARIRTMCRLGSLYIKQPDVDQYSRYAKTFQLADKVLVVLPDISSSIQRAETSFAVGQLGFDIGKNIKLDIGETLGEGMYVRSECLLTHAAAMLAHSGEDATAPRALARTTLEYLRKTRSLRSWPDPDDTSPVGFAVLPYEPHPGWKIRRMEVLALADRVLVMPPEIPDNMQNS
ncbi:hypothetical protein LTR95_013322, partial [Oleoguttula sp. CCFEE 5521]